jgi:hypothetical protein
MGIPSALDVTEELYKDAVGTVYVTQNGSPEF